MKLLLVVLLALCAQTQAENLSGLVLGVADGDTISLRDTSQAQHRIRLSGVDAPEKAQPYYGLQSMQSLSDLVVDRMVTVQTGKTDYYGHVVGTVLFFCPIHSWKSEKLSGRYCRLLPRLPSQTGLSDDSRANSIR